MNKSGKICMKALFRYTVNQSINQSDLVRLIGLYFKSWIRKVKFMWLFCLNILLFGFCWIYVFVCFCVYIFVFVCICVLKRKGTSLRHVLCAPQNSIQEGGTVPLLIIFIYKHYFLDVHIAVSFNKSMNNHILWT